MCNPGVPAERRDVSASCRRCSWCGDFERRSLACRNNLGVERLELEARRLAALTGDGPAASAARKQIVNDVATLRHGGEMKSNIDLLFLTLIVGLCISKICSNLARSPNPPSC